MARLASLAGVSSALLVVSLLAACGPQPQTGGTSAPTPEPTQVRDGVQPAGVPEDVATGLAAPWSILRIPLAGVSDNEVVDIVLVSERDTGDVQQVMPDGSLNRIGTIPGVAHAGEGGLLGLAYLDDGSTQWLYAYLTTAGDNRIIRIPFADELGIGSDPEIVLDGIAKAGNHNGGRIAFGPDGMLYATSGDAGNPDTAQDPDSLNGKILRMTPTGEAPDDNPRPGSLTYSLGHRNPQGLTWDGDGQLWAAEFGQNAWDEFNRIEPGGNYGWPVVEGQGGDDRFTDPWLQWGTDAASPSGLTWIDGTFFMAALGGERLWAIYVDDEAQTASAVEWFTGEYGRIRDVTPGRDGSLWMLTNNTDGRGSPHEGDDRILQVELVELVEG
jgi:glucose/arabinose dehydrogenase